MVVKCNESKSGYRSGCETVSCGTVDYVIQEGDEGSTYSRRWTGVLEAEVSETYTFKTRSDDASYAFIGDKDQDLATFIAHIQDGSRYGNDRTSYRVVDNRSTHGMRTRTGTKALVTGGYYPIIVFFGDCWSMRKAPVQMISSISRDYVCMLSNIKRFIEVTSWLLLYENWLPIIT